MVVRRRQPEGVERIGFMATFAGVNGERERFLGMVLGLDDTARRIQGLRELSTKQGPVGPKPDALLISQRTLLVVEAFSDSAGLDQQVSEHRVDASDPRRRLAFGLRSRALAPLDALLTVTRIVQHQRIEQIGIDAGLRLVGGLSGANRAIAEWTR